MTINHTDRGHASVLSGSVAHRRINCPGSFFLEKDIPSQPAGDKALEGTKAHEVSETLLADFLEYKLTGNEKQRFFEDVDPAIMDAAQGYVKAVWEKVLDQSITGKAYGIEDKFTLDEKLGMYGFVDFWCVYISDRGLRTGVIVDFKYGYFGVDVKDNAQLAFYACALRSELRGQGKDLDCVRTIIYQPRSGDEPYKESKFTAKQLDSWAKKFHGVAQAIYLNQKPKFKVGNWCGFCPAKAVCKSYQKDITAKTALTLVDRDTDFPTPDRLTDEQVSKVVLHSDSIESFLASCKKYALSRFINGNPLPNLKVVEGQSRRKWIEYAPKVAGVLTGYKIDPYRKELITITEAERLLAKSMKKEEAKQILSSVTTKSKAGLIVVPASDARPVASTPTDLLTEIEIEE